MIGASPAIQAQNKVVLLARDGYSVRQIAEQVGCTESAVTDTLRALHVRLPSCRTAACGTERHSAGRPLTGWVQVSTGGHKTWFCSALCAMTWLQRKIYLQQAPAGG